MNKVVTINDYPYQVTIEGDGQPTWVFFHGFLGSQHEFSAIKPKGTCVYIDLLGFGMAAPTVSVERLSVSQQIGDLKQLFDALNLEQVHLVGYSMGARLALSFAMTYPEMIKQLILESGTAGLPSIDEQVERQQKDEKLAQRLEKNGLPDFVAMWEQLPLFATQSQVTETIQMSVRQQRLNQVAVNMANSLRAFGTGTMPNYWEDLEQLTMPVTVITGALDTKFTDLGQRLDKAIRQSRQIIVPEVGHNVHLEAPETYTEILESDW
ncbi:2-succinyl-6-hydroxy-2,4-cyclohexadiene-1-carboxylate synthase [Weissella tructae]|uniref:Putative 2-succinyl-6-hydroxy-2,4-cyclohexadiene-1-carboxylate synthase n=2 Tax=Weissella TaxID=46255 RepID=A0A075U174_9LACO|nr:MULTISPECIES: 2-succinyl-6-hydroxy-2,4-cyclohexadiene-1-carboxylate synthase [Weissella]AIG65898.1 2-succinyl-6-hydroxy-2, 4-cyclohexadiene-1-carboxylate synthase [Weissella tructae]AIM63277.1 2-succinyl-6-hydroxy-2, 4-cyclohexadiene-1-carboxylate synthase [Weissella ceti]AIM64611.1 2-succinyl-6-hydroxy-2, 4-cyclohexadiene-1-carboxylate synthase [Weissella ceti]ELA07269.1 alpha/beta fold family hydrolase [Weissella ceti NC36]QVV91057.1 2-succinyl-6-hydroxy-2,4-cyclohexadiene-1-carboxylate s